jgi:hypothetical protein
MAPWPHGHAIFIPPGQDLQELIDIMDRLKVPQEKRPKICPKIEKPQADAMPETSCFTWDNNGGIMRQHGLHNMY